MAEDKIADVLKQNKAPR